MAIPIGEDPYYKLGSWIDNDVDDLELQAVRYKPDSLDSLVKLTEFNKKEIQLMYRGFKQGCPNGIVTLEQFKEIYAQFFPHGGSASPPGEEFKDVSGMHYAQYVFNTFDADKNGSISFDEFVVGLSVLTRGSLDDKLQWVFTLYDISRCERITREELHGVVRSVYNLMGRTTEPPYNEDTITAHVSQIFDKMDRDRDGIVTKQEFFDACKTDDFICDSLLLFDTRF